MNTYLVYHNSRIDFQKVQKGDMIFTLEKDRRSGYPIFDQARVLKVGESKPMASNGKEGFVNSIELVIKIQYLKLPFIYQLM
jgi:hypothetical protein